MISWRNILKLSRPGVSNILKKFPSCGMATSSPAKKPRKRTLTDAAIEEIAENAGKIGSVEGTALSSLIRKHRAAFVTPRATPGEMYILDEELADRIADFMNISPQDDCIILESNPGLGVLTKKILERGAKRMRLLEGREMFAAHLSEIQQKYPGVDLVCPLNVMDFRSRKKLPPKSDPSSDSVAHADVQPPDELRTRHEKLELALTSNLPSFDWNLPVPSVKFVGVVPERSEMFFLRRILNSVAKKNLLAKLGRPEFFLVLSPRQRYVLTLQPGPDTNLKHYRWATVAFQTLFDLDTLHEIPRSLLLPPVGDKKVMAGSWYLVHLTARLEVPLGLDWSLLPEFIFFVNQAMMARTRPLIAWIESWIPGFGVKILDMGYTVYDKTGDLSAMQYLELFKCVSDSVEYRTSNLKTAYALSPDALYNLHDEDPDELSEEKDLGI